MCMRGRGMAIIYYPKLSPTNGLVHFFTTERTESTEVKKRRS